MKIYLINQWNYEDSDTDVIKAFVSEKKAKKFCDEANKETQRISDEIVAFRNETQDEIDKYWQIMINNGKYSQDKITKAKAKFHKLSKERLAKETEIRNTFSIKEFYPYINLDANYEYTEFELEE